MIISTVLCTILIGAALADPEPHHIPGQTPRTPGSPFKLCVPESAYKPCLKMVEQGKNHGVHMTCVIARDRMDCIDKIESHKADFGAVDPEDMYVAAQHANKFFAIFKEIRTKEEPKNEFRYEAVSVIRKDLEINDLHQLQGLRSCHTGVGRNVGYKIPITKLTKMGILPPLNNPEMSPRENELNALSTFFSKACVVGKWSPDPEINNRLKNKYSNLCQLCEFPDKCDYPDQNAGYEGALRCLTKGNGQVAWTKVIYVKKFFGMPYGTKPARNDVDVNKDDYMYLCPDTTKRPITGPPCIWAARPWQGYMANTEITNVNSELKELRDEISKLNNLGEQEHADWITSVLALNNETLAVDNNGPYSPKQYLDKANYTDVIERNVLKPARKIRICVTTPINLEKCELLSKAAYSNDIRPEISCTNKGNKEACYKAINQNEADIVGIDVANLLDAEKNNMEPLTSDVFLNNQTYQHAVAVVKKGSGINKLSDLQGKKACLVVPATAVGSSIVSHILRKASLVTENSCSLKQIATKFFSSVQQSDDPIKCLVEGQGDVAFVGDQEMEHALHHNELFEADKYELLSYKTTNCAMNNINECALETIPGSVIVSRKNLPAVESDDFLTAILSVGKTFSKNPHIFKFYGTYKGVSHAMVVNYANGFVTIKNNKEIAKHLEEYKAIATQYNSCK